MKAPPLKRLLNKREIRTLFESLHTLSSFPVTLGIADETGKWLVLYPDATMPADQRLVEQACVTQETVTNKQAIAMPLQVDEVGYGVFYSAPQAAPFSRIVHQILELLVQKALTQKALAQETLERYREINLLYRIHETIGASLDLDEVIQRVLQQSIRIIKTDGGTVFLSDPLTHTLQVYGSLDLDIAQAEQALIGQSLSHDVFESGRSRILNNLQNFVRPNAEQDVQLCALLCVPFKSGDKVLGVITLGRKWVGPMFTAGDEKLLTALASQAGIAIANAREAQEREKRLRQQIQELRIEIDEAKKQQEVAHVTESDYFRYLQETAAQMRTEFDI